MSDETSTELTAKQQACPHEWIWDLDPCNEAGWRCWLCDLKLGYRPDLDRTETAEKVSTCLSALHDAELIYVSNGTLGEVVTENVAARCHEENRFDQDSILQFILADPDLMPESTFWQEEAAKKLAGLPTAVETWKAREEQERAGQLALPGGQA